MVCKLLCMRGALACGKLVSVWVRGSTRAAFVSVWVWHTQSCSRNNRRVPYPYTDTSLTSITRPRSAIGGAGLGLSAQSPSSCSSLSHLVGPHRCHCALYLHLHPHHLLSWSYRRRWHHWCSRAPQNHQPEQLGSRAALVPPWARLVSNFMAQCLAPPALSLRAGVSGNTAPTEHGGTAK
jgi:hypothetical protein